MADGEDLGGLAAASSDIIAQFQTTRVRSLWTNYLRFDFSFDLTISNKYLLSQNISAN